MKTITLRSGDSVPIIGLGTWQAPPEVLQSVIDAAVDVGYRHFDCAAIYLNEVTIGNVFSQLLPSKKVTRDELWITSKLWNSFHYPEDVEPALKQTLSDLQLDYLDLYLMHWPLAFKPSLGLNNPDSDADFLPMSSVPIESTWQAMHECCQKGLVKNIGVSNCSVSKLQQIISKTDIVPQMNQVECHPFLPQVELQKYCDQHGIAITAYSPLGSGGRPQQFKATDEPVLLQHQVVNEIAQTYAVSPAQVLLAWLLQRNIIAIPKSSSRERLQQNLAAASLLLTDDDCSLLNSIGINYRYVNARFWESSDRSFNAEVLWS